MTVYKFTTEQAAIIDGRNIGGVVIQLLTDADGNKILSKPAVNAVLSIALKSEFSDLSWLANLEEIPYNPQEL